jgi:hypothetical protein
MQTKPVEHGYYKTHGCSPVSLEAFVKEELLQYGTQQNIDLMSQDVMQHMRGIMGQHEHFEVCQRNNYTFPDGENYSLPYFVFRAHQTDVGVSRLTYGLFKNYLAEPETETPCCKIEIVQGRRYIDAHRFGIQGSIRRVMMEHIIRAFQPLLEKNWKLILSKREENQAIAQPYFIWLNSVTKFQQMSNHFGSDEWSSPLMLNTDHRKVKRLFREPRQAQIES